MSPALRPVLSLFALVIVLGGMVAHPEEGLRVPGQPQFGGAIMEQSGTCCPCRDCPDRETAPACPGRSAPRCPSESSCGRCGGWGPVGVYLIPAAVEVVSDRGREHVPAVVVQATDMVLSPPVPPPRRLIPS
ncbi:MAG: hypothetical protein ABIK96_14100 [bacterium]